MKTEPEEVWVKQLTEMVSSPLSAETRKRALQGMAQVLPRPRFRRRRLLVAATAAIVALVALGFVPVPMGNAAGAWAKALAAAEQATTVYIAGTGDGYRLYIWQSSDGFNTYERYESWAGKELKYLHIFGKEKTVFYSENRHEVEEMRSPVPPDKDKRFLHPLYGTRESLADDLRFFEKVLQDSRISESKESKLWGGSREVVELSGSVKNGRMMISGKSYPAGTKVKIRVEIDPATNLLTSQEEFVYEDGRWQSKFRESYIWNKPIAEELYSFTPPPGSTLKISGKWWAGRIDRLIAKASTQDWIITLHAIDIDRKGDIVLTLYRSRTDENKLPPSYNKGRPPRINAIDDRGISYTQLHCYGTDREFWTTTLQPESVGPIPSSITLTINPYSGRGKECTNQNLTFSNIPLPARQPVDDLFEHDTETIQY